MSFLKFTSLLDDLGATDTAIRFRAATGIFSIGCDLARQATKSWFSDRQTTACFTALAATTSIHAGLPEATVGIAVHPTRFESLRRANGSPQLSNVPPDIDAQEFELHFAADVRLDVLTPRSSDPQGPLARFLSKQGEAIQQVELMANDVDLAADRLRSRFGLRAVYAQARPGAGGTLVNFFLVDFAAEHGEKRKLLVELVEDPRNLK